MAKLETMEIVFLSVCVCVCVQWLSIEHSLTLNLGAAAPAAGSANYNWQLHLNGNCLCGRSAHTLVTLVVNRCATIRVCYLLYKMYNFFIFA